MRSKHIGRLRSPRARACLPARRNRRRGLTSAPRLAAQQLESWTKSQARRFYPDDPIWRDGDMRDIPPVAEFDLSKSYEFLHETFGDSVAVSRTGAQREHARRSARFQLVHEPARPPRHDHRRNRPRAESGRRPGAGHVARHRPARLRHHAEVHHSRRAWRHLPHQARSGEVPGASLVGRGDLDEDLSCDRLSRAARTSS